MIYALPIVSFVLSAIAARWALLQRLGYGVLAACTVVLGAAVWAIWTGRQLSGWDGIGHAIFAVFICAPLLLGAGLGALLGGLKRRRG